MRDGEQLTMLDRRVREPQRDHTRYAPENAYTLYTGPCEHLLRDIPAAAASLIITSPPYNIGKSYEKKSSLAAYLESQERVIALCVEKLSPTGSICWQVGNHIHDGGIVPLDIALYSLFTKYGLVLRNRIIWHFEHGLHCSRRLSGRYETVLWFTRATGDYTFHLDPIRVPQKYPGKRYYKGPKAGQYSANPLGKNPGDVWVIPNVKHNHVEKMDHPCQFPVELVERFVLALTNEHDLVIDPYIGSGTTAVAALRHGRRVAGADTAAKYIRIANVRVLATLNGTIRTRPMGREVYRPKGAVSVAPERETVTPLFSRPVE
jgi:adenine-specific DNA-methyltransferase